MIQQQNNYASCKHITCHVVFWDIMQKQIMDTFKPWTNSFSKIKKATSYAECPSFIPSWWGETHFFSNVHLWDIIYRYACKTQAVPEQWQSIAQNGGHILSLLSVHGGARLSTFCLREVLVRQGYVQISGFIRILKKAQSSLSRHSSSSHLQFFMVATNLGLPLQRLDKRSYKIIWDCVL